MSLIKGLETLSNDFKVESKAYSIETHKNIGKAYSKAEAVFKQAAVKWHHSVAKVQTQEHQQHLKAGNSDRANDALTLAKQHRKLAEDIDAGKLEPKFR